MSKQKDTLLRLIAANKGHPSAEELFLECKEKNVKISIATIYRNLNLLFRKERSPRSVFPTSRTGTIPERIPISMASATGATRSRILKSRNWTRF